MRRPRSTRWWYHFPHVWHEESTTWEDVYLLPDLPGWDEDSLWLTVTAALAPEDDDHGELAVPLRDAGFHLDRERLNMIVRAERFTKTELLAWARIALAELGLPCEELVEGDPALFANSNAHARMVDEAERRIAARPWPDERRDEAGPRCT